MDIDKDRDPNFNVYNISREGGIKTALGDKGKKIRMIVFLPPSSKLINEREANEKRIRIVVREAVRKNLNPSART